MGSRQLGELLLRPSSLSRALSRPTSSIWQRNTPSWSPSAAQRNISTTSNTRSTAQAPAQQKPDSNPDSSPKNPATPASRQTSRAIDDLFAKMDSRRPQSSHGEFQAAHKRVFGEGFSPRNPDGPGRPRLDFNAMRMPTPVSDPFAPPTSATATPQVSSVPEREIQYPRLNASTGRSIVLDNARGRDIVRGLGMLASLCSRNKVRADQIRQRFHERPGLKRKRLKSERWRARFKVGFNQVVGRVSELTRKGW